MEKKLEIYTDGACSGNPGPGAFGVLFLENNNKILTYSEYSPNTTSNRMELSAVLWAIKKIDFSWHKITLYSDSQYVVKGINEWLDNWQKNGWKTSSGSVKNIDLWIEMAKLLENTKKKKDFLKIIWIQGHNNNLYNDEVDRIAKNKILTK